MRYFYPLLFLALLLPFCSQAQSNYKPSYVVTPKGDTIHGFIDYKEWENNPGSINFKLALNEAPKQFTPDEINYFQVGQLEAYRTYSGPVSTDQVNLNNLTTGRDTSFRTAAVFLKVERDGKYLTLYSYSDDLKKRYFVTEKTNNKPFELIYRIYLSPDQGNNKTVTENKYKGQLIYLSSKYNSNTDELKTIIENSSYDQDLVNVVKRINPAEKQVLSRHNPGISFYVGISSGITSIKPPNNVTVYSSNYTYVNSYLPRISFGINAYTNPDIGKLIFRGEIAFFANNNKTYFNQYFYANTRSYFTLNQYTLSFNPQIVYNIYNSAPFKFYLDAGVSFNFSKYGNYTVYNGSYGTTSQSGVHFNPSWMSIPFSAGVTLKNKIGIFVTYTVPALISTDSYEFSSTQIGINYIFGQRK